MELQNFLTEALKEKFKADKTVEAIYREIIDIAEEKTLEKYKNKTFFTDGMEFELIGVKANFYATIINPNRVDINLAFFCKSKLSKKQRERLEQVKIRYNRRRFLEYSNSKRPIWRELRYSVELDNVLSGNINLIIN